MSKHSAATTNLGGRTMSASSFLRETLSDISRKVDASREIDLKIVEQRLTDVATAVGSDLVENDRCFLNSLLTDLSASVRELRADADPNLHARVIVDSNTAAHGMYLAVVTCEAVTRAYLAFLRMGRLHNPTYGDLNELESQFSS